MDAGAQAHRPARRAQPSAPSVSPAPDRGKRSASNEGGTLYTQDFDPVSDSLGLTAIFAALPLVTLFVLLGGLRMKAQWAALISLAVSMLVALDRLRHARGQTLLSAPRGRHVRPVPDHVDRHQRRSGSTT